MHPGLPPFHIQVPIPPDHLTVENDDKFDINWQKLKPNKLNNTGISARLKKIWNIINSHN